MMLLFTRGSSSSGRFGVGSGPHAQVDPGGRAIVLSRSTSTVSELQPVTTSNALNAMAMVCRPIFPFLLCGEANGTLSQMIPSALSFCSSASDRPSSRA